MWMRNTYLAILEGFVRLFPRQREIILRSRGKVRYLCVGRAVQILILGLAVAGIGCLTFVSDHYLSHQTIVASRDTEIFELRRQKHELTTSLSEIRNKASLQELSLTATRKTTIDLVASNQALEFKLAHIEGKLKERIAETQSFALSYMGEVEEHAYIVANLRERARTQADLSQQLAGREQHIAVIEADRLRLEQKIATANAAMQHLREEVNTLDDARLDLRGRLDQSQRDLQQVVQEKRVVEAEREDLGSQVVELSDRLETIEMAQVDIVLRLSEQAGDSSDALRQTLTIAGLDVDHLLGRLARLEKNGRGVGGPFLSLGNQPRSELTRAISTVERRIDDFQRLQDLMERLPFAAPLDEFRLTSGYGRRIDPFTSRFALHSGIDLASRKRAPVHVTSPGVVTFVGWKAGYGKIVEVDHGLGIRTRYAHLSNIYVKRGQNLRFREKVGEIGSTGRSTGEHLHYEVIVDGRSQDPAAFIKAGQYVFKK